MATTWARGRCGRSTCASASASDVARFVAEGRPVLGICNGFQALVKAGLLPGGCERNASR